MFMSRAISAVLVTSLLSSCGALSLGDTSTLEAQEDAVFACAKAEGDEIFPIAIGTTLASGTVAMVQIEPNERVSPALAAKINACAADTLAAAQVSAETSTEEPVIADVRPVFAAVPEPSFVAPTGCVSGGGVLQGGSSYCVGTTD